MSRIIRKTKKKGRAFVALSGGVDSSVSAALLMKDGFDVVGVHMKCWSTELSPACTAGEDERSARLAAAHLDIPFYVWNFIDEYKTRVVDYMLEGYRHGITPNPDMMCNKEIKFGLFYEKAMKLGADYVATGHYARISRKDGKARLLRGRDSEKDQSYFLAAIKPEVLNRTFFPVGEYAKTQVRQMAKRLSLPNAERKDSQGICFVGKVDVQEFLKEHITPKRGDITDLKGNVLGTHEGVMYYTIGQRQGIGLAGGPYYVVKKDVEGNRLIVSRNENDLYCADATIDSLLWFEQPEMFPYGGNVQLRYRHSGVPATIEKEEGKYTVRFQEPQRAVTPGQFAVLYQGEAVAGAGIVQA